MTKFLSVISCLLLTVQSFAHPMPNSVLAFSVNDKNIVCNLQLPLKELQFAVGFDVTNNTENLFKNHYKTIETYIQNHFYIQGESEKKWQMTVAEMQLETTSESDMEMHQKIICKIIFKPDPKDNSRQFAIFYDGIMHQLVTHKAIVSIKQDWQNGIVGHQNSEIGLIAVDLSTNTVKPFVVNLRSGSNWTGFQAMFWLGIDHIAEGIDHLMFLLLLLLPAPLLVVSHKWSIAQGWKNSFIKIIKIVTGFTIGHSVMLFLGTMQWFETPTLLVEILIAMSILITAIHAIKPIFYKHEIWVAIGFGLIHGLAFSQTLVELELTSTKMFLSLLGFNLGIEAMQMFVVVMVMPWLVYLSQNKSYHFFRIAFAAFGMIASVGWIAELLTDTSNFISNFMSKIPSIAKWLVLILIIFSLMQYIFIKTRKNI